MKSEFIYICLMFCVLISCNKETKPLQNHEFKTSIDNYCQYIDSVGFNPNLDYIFIEAKVNNDSTVFVIYLDGGAYTFLNETEKIVDFITYKRYSILLVGDYPNDIVDIQRNKKLNVINDIVKVKYQTDYKKYLEDKHSVAPLIYDYMNMVLTFKKNILVRCKRQYY